jgi:hypothetical protein
MHDLVSYNEKHNEANGEGGNDGESHNSSWNCGVEGETDDLEVVALREQQKRNFLATLFLSQGVPMVLHGDELGRTQGGNNNVYAQDSEIAWIDWERAKEFEVLTEFVSQLAKLRREHPVFRRRRHFKGRPVRGSAVEDIGWFTPAGEEMSDDDWDSGFAKSVTVFLNGEGIREPDARGERVTDDSFFLLFNGHHEPLDFTLPDLGAGERWQVEIDTAAPMLAEAEDRSLKTGEDLPSRRAPCSCCERSSEPVPPHLPAPGRPVPVSTYRVQLRPPAQDHPGFGFDDAAAVVPYLADLGVTHLYCSPYLQAAPGSAHGYDVVDHNRLNDELGGQAAFDRLSAACREAGLGIVLDVVPNHTAVSEPESQNAAWWSLLREGRASPHADWFDVDWDSPDNPGKVLVPVLGGPLGDVVDELELLEDRIRYYDHEVPIAPGTRVDGDVLATLERQHYRLAHWRTAGEELDYRRFFDVTTLAGVRVEVPAVFDATHRLVLQQVRDGVVDGLRIDHPDGWPTPAATSTGWPRPPTGRGWSSRRSSSPARSCRTSGPPPAPPATTPSTACSACSSTPPASSR